jgi:hypothetical protein
VFVESMREPLPPPSSRVKAGAARQKRTDAVAGQKAKDPVFKQEDSDHTAKPEHREASLPRKPRKVAEGSKKRCAGNQSGSTLSPLRERCGNVVVMK